MHPTLKKVINTKAFKIIAGLVLFYLLFAYIAVNPLAKKLLPWAGEKYLNSRLTVEQVKFDPLHLSLAVDGLTLSRLDAPVEKGTLSSFKRLFVDLEAKGIFKRAWLLKSIRLTAPYVNVDVKQDGQLNWAALIDHVNQAPKEAQKENAEIARVIIQQLVVESGNVEYAEYNRPKPFETAINPFGFALAGFSTLPKDRGDYAITVKLPTQEAVIKWKGELAVNPLASKGEVDISGIKIAKIIELAKQTDMPLHITSGNVNTHFQYQFAMQSDSPESEPYPVASVDQLLLNIDELHGDIQEKTQLDLPHVEINLPHLDFSMKDQPALTFSDVTLAAKSLSLKQGEQALFSLPTLAVNNVAFDLAQSQLNIAEVKLSGGVLNANRAKNGALDWALLAGPTKNKQVKTDALTAVESVVAEPEADITEAVETTEAASPFVFDFAKIQLENWQAHLDDQSFKHPLKAGIQAINLAFQLNNASGGIVVKQIETQLAKISINSSLSSKPIAQLSKIQLTGGEVDVEKQQVNIGKIVLSGLNTQVLRQKDQTINWQNALLKTQTTQPDKPKKSAVKSQQSDWKLALNTVALNGANVHIEDQTLAEPVVLDVANAAISLRNASLDLSKAIPVNIKLPIKQGGQLNVNGRMAFAPLSSKLKVKLDDFALKPFSSYVNQFALLTLEDGKVDIHGQLALNAGKAFSSQYTGGFAVKALNIQEEESGKPFLAWQSVATEDMALNIGGDQQLSIANLNIIKPSGKFIIFEDKTMNVTRILREQAASDSADAKEAESSETTDADPTAFPVSIERISIDNGDLEFADLSLIPQFGTHVNSLSGVISGLSNDANVTAKVELDGKVDEYGSAKISGALQPFKATDFTDMKLAFHNLEMNKLTPYSGKFAGRKIEAGKLSVDLAYKIKERKLQGENKLVINKIKLGERVDSKDAASLPLDLAIALLEDSDGVIDLDLPIEGSLDDPKFKFSKVVWKAFGNLITKIVTAPFRMLGKLFGSDSGDLASVAFEPGRAEIPPEQKENLNKLAEALKKRPALVLTVSPTYDLEKDKTALQEESTRIAILKEMEVPIKDGERPGPIDVANVKAQIAIDNLLKDRKGESRGFKALATIKNKFRKAKPEEIPVYKKHLAELKNTAPIEEKDLLALAQSRVEAMQQYLSENTQLDAKRLKIGKPEKSSAKEKKISLKMAVDVAK